MKSILLSTTALLALGLSAQAADLPRREMAPAPAPVYALPIFTWTGFYVGLNAGMARNGRNASFGSDYSGDFTRDGRVRDPALVQAYGLDAGAFQNVPVQSLDGGNLNSFVLGDNGRRKSAFTAGLQLGYNVQYGGLVLGVEGDFNWMGGRRSSNREAQTGDFAFQGEYTDTGAPVFVGPTSFMALDAAGQQRVNFSNPGNTVAPGPAGTYYNGSVTTSGSNRSAWLSTLRGRTGYAFDRFMVYGTYGLAFQSAGHRTSQTSLTRTDCRPDVVTAANNAFFPVQGACVNTTNTYGGSSTGSSNIGWAAGLGFEWAMTNNVSFGLEYLHADFGRTRTDIVDPVLTAANDTRATRVPVAGVTVGSTAAPAPLAAGPAPAPVTRSVSSRDSHDLVRLKLNYRFGGMSEAAPVLARY